MGWTPEQQRALRAERRHQVWEYIGDRCQHCGKPAEHAHHVDPSTKSFTIGVELWRDFEYLRPELDKCIPLCNSCHVTHHNLKPVVHGAPSNYGHGRCLCGVCERGYREHRKEFEASNRDEINRRRRERLAANRDDHNRKRRERVAANRDEVNRKAREYRAANLDKLRRYEREYRAQNKTT